LQQHDADLPVGGSECERCGAPFSVAEMVDAAVVVALVLALFVTIGGVLFQGFAPTHENGRPTAGAEFAFRLVIYGLGAAYLFYGELFGEAVGKRMVGIRVVQAETWRRPGLLVAAIRIAAKAVTVATFGVGYAMVLSDPERRALHDRLAGTRVIHSG
jgi:uncharacterized RDD family membrane protein YckC